tara:strand:+ start:74 stop:247 length:174 start_codon:yes stop_codon:yes gene_type:complete
MKEYMQEFLDEVGYKLGYDERNMPETKDIEIVWRFAVPVWDYNGLTEYEYYMNEGSI